VKEKATERDCGKEFKEPMPDYLEKKGPSKRGSIKGEPIRALSTQGGKKHRHRAGGGGGGGVG